MATLQTDTRFGDDLSLGKVVHVIGCGSTGRSVVEFLLPRGYQLVMHDEGENPKFYAECSKLLGADNVHVGDKAYSSLDTADTIVASPGISVKSDVLRSAQAQGIQIIGDVEIFMRLVTKPVILVTGSNGKSTVCALLGHVLSGNQIHSAVCGNFGLPVLDALSRDYDAYVVEISSFQIETTPNIHSRVAVLLNVSEDHMDRYDSYAEYVDTKLRVFEHAATSVINVSDAYSKQITKIDTKITIADSCDVPAEYQICVDDGMGIIKHKGQTIARESDFRIVGLHNLFNIASVLAVCSEFEIAFEHILAAVQTFNGLEHRTEFVAEKNNVIWINDSKATNVGATVAAIKGITRPVVLILGGQSKGARFGELCQVLAGKVKAVIVFGEDAAIIREDIGHCSTLYMAKDLQDVVMQANEIAKSGDVVLLSPACASFDMFKNYQDRGQQFKQLVRQGI